jgi:hypothetical protein
VDQALQRHDARAWKRSTSVHASARNRCFQRVDLEEESFRQIVGLDEYASKKAQSWLGTSSWYSSRSTMMIIRARRVRAYLSGSILDQLRRPTAPFKSSHHTVLPGDLPCFSSGPHRSLFKYIPTSTSRSSRNAFRPIQYVIERSGLPNSSGYHDCGRSGHWIKTEDLFKHLTYAIALNPVVISVVPIYNMGGTHNDTDISSPDTTGTLQSIACIPVPTMTV